MGTGQEKYAAAVDGSVQRIVLTGFMGAGKTTVGGLLASRLGWSFVDVDDVVAHEQACSVAQLFSDRGESAFRLLEADAVARMLARKGVVIALGGGALELAETRAAILDSPQTHLVYLHTTLESSLARCGEGAGTRPLLADLAALQARYERRQPHYALAHQTVLTASRTADEVAEVIARTLAGRVATAGEHAATPRSSSRRETP